MGSDSVRDGDVFKKVKECFESECEKNGIVSPEQRASFARFLSQALPLAMARTMLVAGEPTQEDIDVVGEALRAAGNALVEDVEQEEKGQKT